MPRKKSAKRAAKRKTLSVQQMEKEIFTAPVKLIAYINKEMSALKKKENKIKNAFKKVSAQAKKSAARMQTADKLKLTPAGKKKLKKMEKSHNEIIHTQALHDKQLQELTHAIESSKQSQSKLVALNKRLSEFEKEWSKNAKQMKADAAKPKKTYAPVKKVVPAVDQPQVESIEATIDPISLEETAEVVS